MHFLGKRRGAQVAPLTLGSAMADIRTDTASLTATGDVGFVDSSPDIFHLQATGATADFDTEDVPTVPAKDIEAKSHPVHGATVGADEP